MCNEGSWKQILGHSLIRGVFPKKLNVIFRFRATKLRKLDSNNNLITVQFGFRENHSGEPVISTILKSCKKLMVAAFLEFKKEFKTTYKIYST